MNYVPPQAKTLVEALELAAAQEGYGFSHLNDEREAPVFVPYADLRAKARRIAAALQAKGLRKGDRLGLILPDSQDFIATLLGAMVAGVIPVPVYPPMNLGKLDNYLDNTTHILSHAGCSLVVTDGRVRPILGQLIENAESIKEIATLEKLLSDVPEGTAPTPVDVTPDDIAFLQFTSGSTSRPKGVTLTHGNLVANCTAIGGPVGLRLSPGDVAMSWLPLYHDMGLIGFVFTPLLHGISHVRFMSPLLFLKRPSLWLKNISETKANITFAPNFAYGLATRRVRDKELAGLDLSTLRVAGCGAEPIHYGTLAGFAERFADIGFKSNALLPCYGMAEHSLAITFIPMEAEMSYDLVLTDGLEKGVATPTAEEGEGTTRIVACGKAFPLHEVAIVNDADQPLGDRQVGQIVLKGPSIMRGYFNDEEVTEKTMAGGWLHTGDLGYLVDGELYVCGRVKDLIIVNGRNFYPQDIEWQASQVDGVRTGNVVAFGFMDPEVQRERVIVLAESREVEEKSQSIRDGVIARVREYLNLAIDEVIVLPAGSLPKTSSGKLQRRKAAQMFQDDALAAAQGGRWKLIKHLAASRWSYLKGALRKD